MPGQGFGIEPRFGKKQETERSGNKLSDSFPVNRIPIQFKGLLQHKTLRYDTFYSQVIHIMYLI